MKTKDDLALTKLPPQHLDAEESLLSSLMIDNNTLLDVVHILRPEDFYRSAHKHIFSAITDLFEEDEPVDLVTLTNKLKQKGLLEKVGGAVYPAKLIDTAPLAVNARHYAKIIYDKAAARRLLGKANEIVNRCLIDEGKVEDLIDFAEKSIFEISENQIKPEYYPIKDVIGHNFDTIEKLQESKALYTGVPSGFSRLDSLTSGFQPSELIILAARPGVGKTALALNIARNVAVDSNIPVVIFSLEMSKEQLSLRFLCAEARIDSSRLRGGFLNADDWSRLTDAAGLVEQTPIFLDDSSGISALEIKSKARRLKMKKDIGLVIVDYLQLMESRHTVERRDLEISAISRSLKGLSKELNLPVIALSQLNRQVVTRGNKRPQLSDLRESGAIEQDADVVAFIHRDEVYNMDIDNPNKGKAEIILSKNRNGPTGSIELAYLSSYTRFENLAHEYDATNN